VENVLDITYKCQSCGKEGLGPTYPMVCKCGGMIKGYGCPGITGTRDSFGIRNEFIDEKTGKKIDNWKSWEKAGFRQPEDVIKNPVVRESMKKRKGELGKFNKQIDNKDLPL